MQGIDTIRLPGIASYCCWWSRWCWSLQCAHVRSSAPVKPLPGWCSVGASP